MLRYRQDSPRQERTGLRDFFGGKFAQRQVSQRDCGPYARQFDQQQEARSWPHDSRRVGQHAYYRAPPQRPDRRHNRPEVVHHPDGRHGADCLKSVATAAPEPPNGGIKT